MEIERDFESALEAELQCWVTHINTAIEGARNLPPGKKQFGIDAVPGLPANIVVEIKTLILKSGLTIQEKAALSNCVITLVKYALAIPLEWERRRGESADNERAANARRGKAERSNLLAETIETLGFDEFKKRTRLRTPTAIARAIESKVKDKAGEIGARHIGHSAIAKQIKKHLPKWNSIQNSGNVAEE